MTQVSAELTPTPTPIESLAAQDLDPNGSVHEAIFEKLGSLPLENTVCVTLTQELFDLFSKMVQTVRAEDLAKLAQADTNARLGVLRRIMNELRPYAPDADSLIVADKPYLVVQKFHKQAEKEAAVRAGTAQPLRRTLRSAA